MNFSQGHSGTKVQYVNRACFPRKTPEFTKKWARNSYELFVLALSLVWFAGATPEKRIHSTLLQPKLAIYPPPLDPSYRYRPKGVFGKGVSNRKNTSEMRQKCVRNASDMRQKWVLFYWGKEERSKTRQKCIKIASEMRQKCAEHLWGRTPLDDTEVIRRQSGKEKVPKSEGPKSEFSGSQKRGNTGEMKRGEVGPEGERRGEWGRRVGRELSEFLSAYDVCPNVNSPSLLQNSPRLPRNSASSLLRNSSPETVFRQFPSYPPERPSQNFAPGKWGRPRRGSSSF